MNDPPDFVLYGDGRAIVREERASDVLKLVEYRLTSQRIQVLFGAAAHARLFDKEDYSGDQVSDGGSLAIMLRSTQREHLIEIGSPSPADRGARGAAARFADSLQPSRWPADDVSQPPAPYRPGRVAVTFDDSGLSRNQRAWAWPLSQG